MCKEQEVRVKREYLVGICCDQGYGNTFRELNESCKDSFTLDEFLEFRKCAYSNEGCNWYEVDSIVTKHLFVEALELQKNANKEHLNQSLPKKSDDIKSIDFVVSILDNCCEYLDEVDQRKHDHSVRLLKVVIDQLKQS